MTSVVKPTTALPTSGILDDDQADAIDMNEPFNDAASEIDEARTQFAVSANDTHIKQLQNALTGESGRIDVTTLNSTADATLEIALAAIFALVNASNVTLENTGGILDLTLSGDDGTNRKIWFETDGTNRWILRTTGAESGSDAGTRLQWQAYDDAGSSTTNVMQLYRNSGLKVQVYQDMDITGAISKGSGTFKIDDLIDPDNRFLLHGFVEAPEYGLLYRGVTQLNKGEARQSIDGASGMDAGTFAVLARNAQVRVQSRAYEQVRGWVADGDIFIECENPDSDALVDWLILAERNDPLVHWHKRTDDKGHLKLYEVKQ